MSRTELNRRALHLFDEACDLPPGERTALIDAQCAGDDALRRRVLALLAQDGSGAGPIADERLGAGAHVLAREVIDAAAEPLPDRIGPYRIVRELGRGGMGVVYEAVQEEPRRRVAIKILREGFTSPDARARFRREVHLLGQLQHRGIAHVYDAGKTRIGHSNWPYFAMEYIDGLPLDRHAETAGLGLRERLELVARVCDAVQHAHQKAILHRDLKMENVLVIRERTGSSATAGDSAVVDAIGQPKVLDFGVARFAGDSAPGSLHVTQAGQLVGTLAYMSPEQLAGPSETVDTRADVYAIGVMLYALLAKRMPHDLGGRGLAEATRLIGDIDPPRLGAVDPRLRGDVETIVAKAMEKDRTRRYGSTADLADDIRRHLRDEPIEARSATAFYTFRKFARRNKGLMTGLAATAFMLVAGAAVAGWMAVGQHRSNVVSQRSMYRASLSAAASAMREHDIATAAQHLDAAPLEFRGWEWHHLFDRLDQSVRSASIGPDGGAADQASLARGHVQLWLADDGATLCLADRLPGADAIVVERRSAATLDLLSSRSIDAPRVVAPDTSGARLYVQSDDGGAAWYDVATGSAVTVEPLESRAHAWSVTSALPDLPRAARTLAHLPEVESSRETYAFSPDGRWLARRAGSSLWIVATDRAHRTRSLGAHREGVAEACFSSDGRYVVTAGFNRRLAMFDLDDDGRLVWERADAHDDAILAVAFSPDDRVIASGGQDMVLRVHDAATGRPIGRRMGHREAIRGIVFDETGDHVFTAGTWEIKSWDTPGRVRVDEFARGARFVRDVAISGDGALLASASEGELTLWDVASGVRIATWSPAGGELLRHVAFGDGDERLVVLVDSGAVTVDLRTGRSERWVDDLVRAVSRIVDRAMHPSRPASEPVLDARDPDVRALLEADGRNRFRPISVDRASQRMAVVPASDEGIVVLDLAGGGIVRRFDLEGVGPLLLFDRGTRLAVETSQRHVRLFDVETGRMLGELRGHTGRVTSLAALPGCDRLVSASEDRTIRLWDLRTMEEVFTLRGHLDTVNALACAPNGDAIFSASDDYALRRWETRPHGDVVRAREAWHAAAPRLEPIVAELLRTETRPGDAAARLEADPALTARERSIARQILFRMMVTREGPDST